MSGNVWEWLRSEFKDYPYRADDGRENPASDASRRVLRGGSWFNSLLDARAAARYWLLPNYWLNFYGLRVVRPPSP
jgi:formylglycine-generating enzyme required for sulfatase activity